MTGIGLETRRWDWAAAVVFDRSISIASTETGFVHCSPEPQSVRCGALRPVTALCLTHEDIESGQDNQRVLQCTSRLANWLCA